MTTILALRGANEVVLFIVDLDVFADERTKVLNRGQIEEGSFGRPTGGNESASFEKETVIVAAFVLRFSFGRKLQHFGTGHVSGLVEAKFDRVEENSLKAKHLDVINLDILIAVVEETLFVRARSLAGNFDFNGLFVTKSLALVCDRQNRVLRFILEDFADLIFKHGLL